MRIPGPRSARPARGRLISPILAAALLVVPAGAAAQASPAPSPDVPAAASSSPAAAQELYRVTIDAADLPEGTAVAGMGWFELTPGSSVTSPPRSQPDSVAIELVLSGAYEVTTDGRTVLLPASADGVAPSPVARPAASPGSATAPIVMGSGDALVYLDNQHTTQVARATGDAPVLGLSAGIFSIATAPVKTQVDGEWTFTFLAFADDKAWDSVPDGPVTLTLTLEPTAPTATPPAGSLVLTGEVPGTDGVFVLRVDPAGATAS